MTMPIRESRLAMRDLGAIEDRIAADNAEAAFRFVRAVRVTYGRIARWPLSGRLLAGPDFRMSPVRGFPDYVVIWRVREDAVEIYRVFHGRLDHLRVVGGKRE
jgi:plasmid stabilization system protein ParE